MTAPPTPLTFQSGDGGQLRGDRRGDPADPMVLLLHGAGQTRYSWSRAATRLADAGFCALAVDLRGHGDSEPAADGDYTRHAFARDVLALRQQVGSLFGVVGASLGGISALLADDECADALAEALVLVDIAPRIEQDGAERILEFMADRPDGFASLEEVADALAAYNPNRPRTRDLAGLSRNLRLGEDGRYRWHWDPALINGSKSLVSDRDPAALRRAARQLRIPCLLVRGRHSDLLTEDGVAEFRRLVPHAHHLDIHGAGHMVAGDSNDVFSDAVVDFLDLVWRQRASRNRTA